MFNLLSQAATAEAVTEVATEVAAETASLGFTTDHLGEALLCSGAGMVGIFIVVGIIIFSVSILNKVGSAASKKN